MVARPVSSCEIIALKIAWRLNIMKTFLKMIAYAVAGIVLAGTLATCEKKKDDNLLLYYFLYESLKQHSSGKNLVSVMVVDANTGAPVELGDTPMTVTVSGEDKDRVVDAEGNPVEGGEFTSSIFDLYVKGGTGYSEKNPVNFSIVTSVDGYISGSSTVVLGQSKDISSEIRLVSISSTPEGVVADQREIGSASNGVISSTVDVDFPVESKTGAQTSVNIPASTVLTDSDGNRLSGTLTATMAYFNDRSDSSIASFPGGLVVTTQGSDGTQSDGIFSTAGFLAFEISDSNGKKASSFSKSLTMTMQLPEGTKHPLTGVAIKKGDVIPVWSYNESTGEWSDEGDGAVGSLSDGLYTVTFKTNHLSYYNLDWKDDRCDVSRKINITGNTKEIPLDIELKSQSGTGFYRFLKHEQMSGDVNKLYFYRAPETIPMTINAYTDGEKVGSVLVDSLCGETSVSLPVTITEYERVDVPVDVAFVCEEHNVDDSDLKGYAYYRSGTCSGPTCSYKFIGQYDNGEFTLEQLKKGEEYDLLVVANHSEYGSLILDSTFSAASSGLSLDEDICYIINEEEKPADSSVDGIDLECGKPMHITKEGGFTDVYTQLYMNQLTFPVGDCNPETADIEPTGAEHQYTYDDGILTGIVVTEGGDTGNISLTYTDDGYIKKIVSDKSYYKEISFTYDSAGRVSSGMYDSANDEDDEYTYIYTDSTSHFPVTVQTTVYNFEGSVSYTYTNIYDDVVYDSNGNVTSYTQSYTSYNSLGGVDDTGVIAYTYEYDANGNLVSDTDDDGVYTTTYTYNSNDQVTEYLVYDESDSLSDSRVFSYDSDGTMSSYIHDSHEGGDILTITFDYSAGSSEFIRSMSGEKPSSKKTIHRRIFDSIPFRLPFRASHKR